MAKKTQQPDNELGDLPPELQVDAEILSVVDKISPVSDLGDDNFTDTAGDGDGDETGHNPDGETAGVAVVVTKGNTVRHDGQDYPESRTFTLSAEDAQRLIRLGVVTDVKQLRKLAWTRATPVVSVQSGT
ncbi:hypothetical protein BJP43_01300 [Candidatus Williamhamiltonella defendens]|uniref:Uncharacterized protein n=2 Tax=Candidatus Williamhamiltonella defendens TaxID=138072 RepID=A0A2D3TBH6_9ENTR|nr:hypothetical protein BJP43_01300 [Candidatus Hamiltonella defensa]